MTLKEKIQQEKVYINTYDFKLTKESVEKFEQIADDYAIEFGLWLSKEQIHYERYWTKEDYKNLLIAFKNNIEYPYINSFDNL